MPIKKTLFYDGLLLTCAMLWGSTFSARKIAAETLGPMYFTALTFFLAMIVLVPLSLFTDRKNKTELSSETMAANRRKCIKYGTICGTLNGLGVIGQQLALETTDAGTCSFITTLYIIIIPFLSIRILNRRLHVNVLAASLMGVAGLALISFNGALGPGRGEIITMICSFMFALEMTLLPKYLQEINPVAVASVEMAAGMILSFIAALLTGEHMTLLIPGKTLFATIYVGAIGYGIAHALRLTAQKKVSASVAGLICSLESVFGLLFGVVLLHEQIGIFKALGCILMLTAIIVAQKEPASGYQAEEE